MQESYTIRLVAHRKSIQNRERQDDRSRGEILRPWWQDSFEHRRDLPPLDGRYVAEDFAVPVHDAAPPGGVGKKRGGGLEPIPKAISRSAACGTLRGQNWRKTAGFCGLQTY
jgi:hypothetical protein